MRFYRRQRHPERSARQYLSALYLVCSLHSFDEDGAAIQLQGRNGPFWQFFSLVDGYFDSHSITHLNTV
jgi:hypothetical protein